MKPSDAWHLAASYPITEDQAFSLLRRAKRDLVDIVGVKPCKAENLACQLVENTLALAQVENLPPELVLHKIIAETPHPDSAVAAFNRLAESWEAFRLALREALDGIGRAMR